MEQELQETPDAGENALLDEEASEASTEERVEETEGEAAPAETGDDEGDKPDDAGKVPDGVQQRINEITRKRREAERRAERAEKRLKELEGRDLNDLDWEEQIAERTLNRSRREQIETDRETAQELAQEAYLARVEAAQVKYPDFAQVTGNPNLSITPAMAETIMDSDYGPDVAYHLGKNPAEAARISKLNPVSQARELGRIEALVSAPKPATNPPPAPVKKVGAKTGGGQKDPSKMTMAEYVAWRKGQS